MNNSYLFRGKRKDNGEWIIGYDTACLTDSGIWTINGIEVTGESYGICANLPDKNGKLIWEKDIVKYDNHIGKVIYENGCCKLKYEYKNRVHKIDITEKYGDYKDMEVVGSISDYVIAFGKAIKALEKQIPRKVIFGYDEQDDIYCPVCKFSLAIVDDHEYESTFYKYCPRCSQKLDWGDIV